MSSESTSGISAAPCVLGPGQWRMWALTNDGLYAHLGHRRYAQEHSADRRPVPVVVTEVETGPYWGWLARDADTPSMIWRNPGLFRMCFPYGPEAEQEHGNGRIVRLVVEAFDV